MRSRTHLDRLVAEEFAEAPEVEESTRVEFRERLQADEETDALARAALERSGRHHFTDEGG